MISMRSALDRNCLRADRTGLISATGMPFTVIVTCVPPETCRKTSAVWLRKSREAIVVTGGIVALLPQPLSWPDNSAPEANAKAAMLSRTSQELPTLH